MSVQTAQASQYQIAEACRITTLYERHAPKTGRLAYLLFGDADLAEDLTSGELDREHSKLDRQPRYPLGSGVGRIARAMP